METENYYIRKLKAGSYSAFNVLYDMYSGRLYGYCYRYTKSHEDSQDILQDVFTSLWVNRSMIRDENTILYFLFQIAKNRLINKFRSQVNSLAYEDYVSYSNNLAISVDNTHSEMEFDDLQQTLEQFKKTLSSTQRQVYEYSKEQGISNTEIATLLGISKQTVKNQLSLALKVFREKLKNHNYLILLIYLLNF